MKKLIFTLLCFVAISGYAQQDKGEINNPSTQNFTSIQNYIEVTGCSEITLTPDIFNILIVIDEEDSKGRLTVAEQQEELIRELTAIGINVEKQLKLSGINSQFAKRKEAYSTINYNLKLTSNDQLMATFEIFDRLYISKVYLESYESSKLSKAKVAARAAAIKDAKMAAKKLAQSLGQKIGNCFYIYDMSNDDSATNYAPRTMLYKSASPMNSHESMDASAPLDAKDIKLKYSVRAKFILYY